MKRILVFCFFPAFVPPSNGGESRLFNFYRALSRHHHITLLSSGHQGVDEQVVNHGANFVERRIPKDECFARAWAELTPYAGAGDMSGPCIAGSGRMLTRLHLAYLEEYEQAEVIVHESPFTVDYDLFAGLDAKPRLYNAYNCESDLYATLHPGAHSKPVQDLVRRVEKRTLQVADCVLYCNEADLESFQALAPGAGYARLFAPNGMLALPAYARQAASNSCSAVFMGSAHAPNVQAALFIANELAPQLPDVTFDVLGNCLPEGTYCANVIRHGLVSTERKHELLSQASVALNPMAAGSGSNVKVFDYFSHALPVVSTAVGMRGVDAVDGRDYLLAELPEFAATLAGWRDQQGAWAQLGTAGRELGVAKYTWESIVKPVADYLNQVVVEDRERPVLVLNDYNPMSTVGGGATRTRGLYAAVADWSPVVFICFSSQDVLSVERHGPAVTVVSVPTTATHKSELLRHNALSPVAVDDVVASMQAPQNLVLLRVYEVLKAHARAIVVEHPYMAGVPISYGDRFIYSSQNNETQLKRRLFEPHPKLRPLIGEVELLERNAIERAAAVVAVSAEDALSLTRGVRRAGPVVVVRNGADAPVAPLAFDLEAARTQVRNKSVVFLGSAHPPNLEAVHFIARSLAPACPDIQFNIIGSVCDSVGTRAPKNLKLWGILDDSRKAAVMQSCLLAINPMSSGSGSNVKLADFLGNGLFTVTTEFGQRGYPEVIRPHVSVVDLKNFVDGMRSAVARLQGEPERARGERRALFDAYLSMKALGKEFVSLLQGLEQPRKRALLVTYRYTSPAMGGAESMMEQLLRALDASGHFDIDLIAAECSSMDNRGRFSETYHFDSQSAAFTDLRHTRFARFAVDGGAERAAISLPAVWAAQCLFEMEVYQQLRADIQRSGLAWGWSDPDGSSQACQRWALCSSGIHLDADARVRVQGEAPAPLALLVQGERGELLFNGEVAGRFDIEFNAKAGSVELLSSTAALVSEDPRPLAFRLTGLLVDDVAVDLRAAVLCQVAGLEPEKGFDILHHAAQRSRTPLGARLTDLRGPWSSGLETYLAHNVGKYDLVITHNNVFRPAIAAIEHAKRHQVPSILIPHAHLDDDYYHFPDVLESALEASLVLAAPRAACDFYRRRGCATDYLPAGIDTREAFGDTDRAAFKSLYADEQPFMLVLGRKAGAKGYQRIIDAVAEVNRGERNIRVVLIGPDDDGLPVDSPFATYLGRQPREVVRGALLSCVALVNMSSSESFGIVLLEAWMAGKPVIANSGCAAFHDMAEHGVNALLVEESGLSAAILQLATDPELCDLLASEGRKSIQQYDWDSVGAAFVRSCVSLVGDS